MSDQKVRKIPMEDDWEWKVKKDIERYFWPWEKVEEFRKLRGEYLLKSYRRWPHRTTDKKDLLPPDLLQYIFTANCKKSPFHIEREAKRKQTKSGEEIEIHNNPIPLTAGHFGVVWDYSKWQGEPAVLKLQRYENVKGPLDVYSYLMEIIITLIIQQRDLNCTAQILNVVKTPTVGDIGCVMEKLSSNLYDFFMKGPGAIKKFLGLQVLRDVAAKLRILQKTFNFRHRDFRMKNVMLTGSSEILGSARIIDFGKSSIDFQGKHFSAYSGQNFEETNSDWDLAFFFGDMLIQFHKKASNRSYKQAGMYEPYLAGFLRGVSYKPLVYQENYQLKLMTNVLTRRPETKMYSKPKYVYQTLNEFILDEQ